MKSHRKENFAFKFPEFAFPGPDMRHQSLQNGTTLLSPFTSCLPQFDLPSQESNKQYR